MVASGKDAGSAGSRLLPVPPVISQGMMAVFAISLSKLLIDVGNFILTVGRTIPRQRKDSAKL